MLWAQPVCPLVRWVHCWAEPVGRRLWHAESLGHVESLIRLLVVLPQVVIPPQLWEVPGDSQMTER